MKKLRIAVCRGDRLVALVFIHRWTPICTEGKRTTDDADVRRVFLCVFFLFAFSALLCASAFLFAFSASLRLCVPLALQHINLCNLRNLRFYPAATTNPFKYALSG